MKHSIILSVAFLLIAGCANTNSNNSMYNPYEINPDDLEIKTVNGKEIIFIKKLPMENTAVKTTTVKRKVEHRYIVKRSLIELNANTIQAAINGPMREKCAIPIIVPVYTNPSVLSKNQFSTQVSLHNLKGIYSALNNKNENNAKYFAKEIFNSANNTNARYILYGKDHKGRNVGYVYKLGYEDLGIVFYYPDNFNSLLNSRWKSPIDYGWSKFIDNFINVMKDYNPHIKFKKCNTKYDVYYLLTYY